MTNEITRNLLTRLAKSVSGDMKHTQKLDAFAKVLGYPDQTALMADLKSKEGNDQKPKVPSLSQKGEIFTALVIRDNQLVNVDTDIRPWLDTATEEELIELSKIDFRGNYPADDIFHHMVHLEIRLALRSLLMRRGSRMAEGEPAGSLGVGGLSSDAKRA